MKLSSEALRALYQDGTARTVRDSGCIPQEMLVTAASGDLGREQREAVADHLAVCSSCAKEYGAIRALQTSLNALAENTSISLGNESDSRRAIEPASTRLLLLPERPVRGDRPFSRSLGESRLFTFYIPAALAAMFLILALVLGAWLMWQRRTNDQLVAQINEKELATAEANQRAEKAETATRAAQEELTRRAAEEKASKQTTEAEVPKGPSEIKDRLDQPLANVPIFELEPRGSTRSVGTDSVTLEAAPDTRLITVILHVNEPPSSGAYSLEVLDRVGRPIWVSRGLRKNRFDNFTVALPRQAFPAGHYRLRLYTLRAGSRELVEEYAIHLQYH